MTRTRHLHDLDRSDAWFVGHKAANLGALARRGLPVPRGVVVVADETDDGIEAAFAGQYETMLDVCGAAAVADAVRRVREGANDERVATYRRAHGPDGATGVAVLLMPMLEPVSAGVAFTAHPLTGMREEAVVTATAGPGQQLVGGEATGVPCATVARWSRSSTRSMRSPSPRSRGRWRS